MKPVKKKNGHLVFKKGFRIKHPLASTYYSKYRIRDNPRVVCKVASDIPEIIEHIDYDYYRGWKKALDMSEGIKSAKEYNFDYDFGEYPPYPHQEQMIAFSRALPCSAIFAETGTGKTYVAIHVLNQRFKKGVIKKALIICPKASIEESWLDDIKKFTSLDASIAHNGLHNLDCDDMYEMIHARDIVITTPSTMRINKQLFYEGGFDQIIVDESTCIGTNSKTAKAIREFENICKFRIIMTGTPGDLEKLYHQTMFIGADLPHSLTNFKGKYYFTHPQKPYISNPLKGSRAKVANKVKDMCLRVSKDVLDLPEVTFTDIYVKPTDKIKEKYNQLHNTFFVEVDGEEMTVNTRLAHMNKLHQVANGHLKIDEETKDIDNPNKLKKVKEIVDKRDHPVIIWAHFKKDFEKLKDVFGQNTPVVNGDTSNVKKELTRFRKDFDVLLAHPKSMQFSVTLNECKTMVYYSISYGLIDYLQTLGRNTRIGQDSETEVIRLNSGGVEKAIFDSIDQKKDFADFITDKIKEVRL